jgi:hypothetical protein
VCPPRLGTADPEYLILPVEIIQAQAADLTGSQAVSDEKHQNRAIALISRSIAFRGGQETLDIGPFKPLRQTFVPHETWRHDAVGDTPDAPAARLGKPKERAKAWA